VSCYSIKTDTYELLDMSYGVESIRIHKKLRLDKRAGDDNWYAALTLPSGKRLIKTTKTDDLETFIERPVARK